MAGIDYYRLKASMDESFKELESYRKASKAIRAQYLGHLFSDHSAPKQKAVFRNKLQQFTVILMRLLASGKPQALVSTDYPELQDYSQTFQLYLNRHLTEIDIQKQFFDAAFRAMFGMAIAKTGYDEHDDAVTGMVDENHFVIDMTHNEWEDLDYIGDRHRLTLDQIEDIFGSKVRSTMEDSGSPDPYSGEMRALQELTDHQAMRPDKALEDWRYVWDVYLPKYNRIVSFPHGSDEILRDEEWDGPEYGPYRILSFLPSGYAIPLPPTHQLYELHMHVNCISRKLFRQADAAKTVYVAEENDDARKIRDANDLGIVGGVRDPKNRVVPLRLTAIDPVLAQNQMEAETEFDTMAGGLKLLAGVSPESETLGQDEMLKATQNAIIQHMQQQMLEFDNGIVQDHAWYAWTRTLHEKTVFRTSPTGLVRVPVRVTPEEREGDFLQYNFEISIYSLREETPTEKQAQLMLMWNQFILPSAQFAMQQGFAPNVMGLATELCRLQGFDVNKFFVFQEPQAAPPGQVAPPGRLPTETTRKYIRKSVPGSTDRSERMNMMAGLSKLSQSNQFQNQEAIGG